MLDPLSPEARALARKGALAYLETSSENHYAGVFVSDLSLKTIQTYTCSPADVKGRPSYRAFLILSRSSSTCAWILAMRFIWVVSSV